MTSNGSCKEQENEECPRRRRNEMSVLAPLLSLYTSAYLALLCSDFLLRDAFDIPNGMLPVYMTILGAYAADKEIRRWVGHPEPRRKGSVFVYLWTIVFMLAFIVYCFRPDFIIPMELKTVTLQVLGVFFGTAASKYIHDRRRVEDSNENRQAVLDLITENGKTTSGSVREKLGISKTSAFRLLQSMENEGLIRAEGEGRGTHYVLGGVGAES